MPHHGMCQLKYYKSRTFLKLSGKVVELAVRQVVHGQSVSNLQSLANPQALEYFKDRDELKS